MPSDADGFSACARLRGDASADLHAVKTLETFLSEREPIDLSDRLKIVVEAIRVLQGLYVHLPNKRKEYGADPVGELRKLQATLEEAIAAGENKTSVRNLDITKKDDLAFNRELNEIFDSVRDLHTVYVPPPPLCNAVALMPFQVEVCFEMGARKYIATNIIRKTDWFEGPNDFTSGAEITHWDGVPIERAVRQSGDRSPGANPAARQALGLDHLTIRPLGKTELPENKPVTVTYRARQGSPSKTTQAEWRVADIDKKVTAGREPARLWRGMGQALDHDREAVRNIRSSLRKADNRKLLSDETDDIDPAPGWADLPEHCEARTFRAASRREYGYIRIRSFNVQRHRSFLRRFANLLEKMPENGLIIDVRDNPGGLILAAERLLQLLTPREIEPEKLEFISTETSHEIAGVVPEYLEWQASIATALKRSEGMEQPAEGTFSNAFPLSSRTMCNAVGQRYYGPLVLITNALSYSATEFFAAGFQDHRIGSILGTDECTGGGGANVATYSDLVNNLRAAKNAAEHMKNAPPGWPLGEELPHQADLRVALRRASRVHERTGVLLEGRGVTADHIHRLTRRDVLCKNVDLIDAAVRLMEPIHSLRPGLVSSDFDLTTVQIKTIGIKRLRVRLGYEAADRTDRGNWILFPARDGDNRLDIPRQVDKPVKLIEVEGYKNEVTGEPVSKRKIRLVPGAPRLASGTELVSVEQVGPPALGNSRTGNVVS